MKEQILKNLAATIGALNSVSVEGKANLGNLLGSISVLENVMTTLSSCEITPIDDADNAAELK